jgi:hypothetical protein
MVASCYSLSLQYCIYLVPLTLHSLYLQYLVAFCSSLFTLSIYNLHGCLLLFTLSTVSTVPSTSSLFVPTWLTSVLHSSLSLSRIYMAASCYSLSLHYLLHLVPLHSPYLPGAFCSSLFTHLTYNLDGCLLLVTLSTVSSVLPSNSYSFLSISTWLAVAFCSSLFTLHIDKVAFCSSLFTLHIDKVAFCSSLSLSRIYMVASCYSLSLQYLQYLVPLHSSYLTG